jgi:hypothetical protein
MTNSAYIAGKVRCEICGSSIVYSDFIAQQNRTSFVCESFYCKQVIRDKETMPSAVYKFRLEHHRKIILQTKAKETARNIYREKIKQKEFSENQAILEQVMKTQAKPFPQPPYVISIPTGRADPQRLSETRFKIYKSHLETIIEKAFSEQPPDGIFDQVKTSSEELRAATELLEMNPSLKTVSEHLCATCKGGCCPEGGNIAFLRVSTMMRIRKMLPDHSAEELLNEYISRLSEQPIKNSCINQTQSGCSLPRELRASVCNVFFCKDIRDIHDKFENEACLAPVLAVRRSNDYWNRFDTSFENEIAQVVLIDEDDIREIELKLLKFEES